jgi:6-phosphogluconolactonase
MPPEVVVVPTDAVGGAAARVVADALRGGVAERGRADWATTGGSTPVTVYQALLDPAVRDTIPWTAVHTWWGDDRFVPGDHPLSNARPFDDILLEAGRWETVHSDDHRGRVRIPAANVHPFRTGEAIGAGRSAATCAADLAAELRDAGLPEADGWPVFDLVFLGLGADGHILSVFPGSPAFDSPRWALDVPAPTHIEPHVARVTLNPAVVTAARRVLVVALGTSKAEPVARAFGSSGDPRAMPAQLAVRDEATWVLDQAAAAQMRD